MQFVWVGHGGGRSEGSRADMVMLNNPCIYVINRYIFRQAI